jgi:hypothetical protein
MWILRWKWISCEAFEAKYDAATQNWGSTKSLTYLNLFVPDKKFLQNFSWKIWGGTYKTMAYVAGLLLKVRFLDNLSDY